MQSLRLQSRTGLLLSLVVPLLGLMPLLAGGDDSPVWAASLTAAEKARQALDFETEQRHLETALRLAKRAGAPALEVGDILDHLGKAYYFLHKNRKAEDTFAQSLILKEEALGEGHPSIAVTLEHFAALESSRGHYSKAEEYLLEALRVREEALGPDHPDLAGTLILLGARSELSGRFQQAEAYYKRALDIRERAFGEEHPLIPDTLASLITLYEDTDRKEEARDLEERYRAISLKHLPPPPPPAQR